jgi:hypothetical protein
MTLNLIMSTVSPARIACEREITPFWLRARLRRVEGISLCIPDSVTGPTDKTICA